MAARAIGSMLGSWPSSCVATISPRSTTERTGCALEGAGPQLSDDHEGSDARDESDQGGVPKLGHSLCWASRVSTASSCGMVGQDRRTRSSLASRAALPATGCVGAFAAGSTTRSAGGEPETQPSEIAPSDSLSGSDSLGIAGGAGGDAHRFRTKRQLRAYSGFGLETHDSGEYRFVKGQLRRNRERVTVLGLNENHNHDLKNIFKSAAISASTRPGPFQEFYAALLAKGRRPAMARLTLARKIAAITLTIWKKGACFDASELHRQAA